MAGTGAGSAAAGNVVSLPFLRVRRTNTTGAPCPTDIVQEKPTRSAANGSAASSARKYLHRNSPGIPVADIEFQGTDACNAPPSRTIFTLTDLPVLSSVSTYRPDSVTAPSAGLNRPPDIPVMKRRIGSALSIPMIEL